MATIQADVRRGANSTELRDPKGPRAPKEALRSLPETIAWLRHPKAIH